jgi:hypothetical protein
VTDVNNARIRRIAPDGAVTTLAGSTYGFADGAGGSAQFTYSLGQLIADGSGGAYVVDGIRVRHVTAAGVVTTVAGRTTAGSADGPVATATFESINGLAAAGSALLIGDAGTVRKLEAGQVTTMPVDRHWEAVWMDRLVSPDSSHPRACVPSARTCS